MTSEAAGPTSEAYSHSHVWLCSSFYDAVRWPSSAMFHCKNNKTRTSEQTGTNKERRAGRLVIDDLCERKDGQRRWPLRASYRSVWLRTSLMTTDLWRCFTYRTYRARQGRREGGGSSSSQFGSIYTTAGSGHASLCSKRQRSDLQSNESVDDNRINLARSVSRLTLQIDFYLFNNVSEMLQG